MEKFDRAIESCGSAVTMRRCALVNQASSQAVMFALLTGNVWSLRCAVESCAAAATKSH